jgi:hypothetical protein
MLTAFAKVSEATTPVMTTGSEPAGAFVEIFNCTSAIVPAPMALSFDPKTRIRTLPETELAVTDLPADLAAVPVDAETHESAGENIRSNCIVLTEAVPGSNSTGMLTILPVRLEASPTEIDADCSVAAATQNVPGRTKKYTSIRHEIAQARRKVMDNS